MCNADAKDLYSSICGDIDNVLEHVRTVNSNASRSKVTTTWLPWT